MKKGIIYQEGKVGLGEVRISGIIRLLKAVAGTLNFVGTGMIVVAVVGILVVYMPLATAEIKYGLAKTEVAKVVRSVTPNWKVPDPEYSIYIPKIFAVSRVIGDVNAGNLKEYTKALKMGVAEAAGLSHPGAVGTTYLFAHSVESKWDFARYNAVFYLLDKLVVGDEVEVYYKGELYKYAVQEREIVPASDVKLLIPQQDEEKLVLQTCYPPGTTWKRLVVVARRK